mgnify:CR=1 FL=1
MAKYMMAFDAGTTSNRCILFDRQGRICSSAQSQSSVLILNSMVREALE